MHVSVAEPSVAEIVTISPAVALDKEKVGVVSLVMLSVFDEPVSEAAARSGALIGDDGAVVSITRLVAALAAETLPAVSVIVDVTLHVPSVRPERSHD